MDPEVPIMISNAPIIPSSAFSVIALLPESMSTSSQSGPTPPPLVHRDSTPMAHSRNDWAGGNADNLALHSRRLSLAPGLGSGLNTTASKPSPLATSPEAPSSSRLAPSSADPASTMHSRTRSSGNAAKQRSLGNPLGSEALRQPRGSVQIGTARPSALLGRSRPGAAGDDLVGALRQYGLEVTSVHQASRLPSLLSSQTSPTSASAPASQPSSSASPQQVILIPLEEPPVLPSLSILTSKGTTPSAVCFQNDIIQAARRVEDQWIDNATVTIERVLKLCNGADRHAEETEGQKPPVLLAYVPSSGLSNNALSACVAAGASGFLYPPFDSHTADYIVQLVAAANAGKTATMVGLSPDVASPQSSITSLSLHSGFDDEAKVVLTPTALGKGAEHESERALNASLHPARRRVSTQLNLSRVISQGSTASAESEHRADRNELVHPLGTAGRTEVAHPLEVPGLGFGKLKQIPSVRQLESMIANIDDSRRRSVDNGGLALAFDRVNQRVVPDTQGSGQPFSVVAHEPEQEAAEGSNKTQFAEVLGETFQHILSWIQIQMGDYESMAAPISRDERVRLVSALTTWDFRPHLLSQTDLYRIACLVFEVALHIEGIAELGITQDQINRFLFAVRAIYHKPNPYHNYIHAIDVLQATYMFLMSIGVVPPFSFFLDLVPGKTIWRRPDEDAQPAGGAGTRRARDILRPQDVFAILMAAIGHDVGHPGLSNAFMKNAKVPLSLVYDDKSVLENMHTVLVVRLLNKHGFGFLLGAPSKEEVAQFPARGDIDWRGFRRVLYSAILATDMSLHFAWIQRLQEFGSAMQEGKITDREELLDEDRVMVSQALIKCADISNPTRPIDVSEHWSTVLLDEWTKQAFLEEELDLPVSVVAGVDARLQAKGQVGFINLFTEPLFKAAAEALPELAQFADSCVANKNTWMSRLEHLEADSEENAKLTALLQQLVGTPTASAQDERFTSLLPAVLPPGLVSHNDESPTEETSGDPQHSPARARPPIIDALRAVYQEEVHHPRNHCLSSYQQSRRMSTPDAIALLRRSDLP